MRPVGFLVALGAASVAHAGGRPYAFTQGADTLPTDQLELESWFSAETESDGTGWDWWLGPVVGLTDRLEVGLFAIFDQAPESPLELGSLRLQLSYSLADKGSWPVDVRLRAEYGLPVATGGSHTFWSLAIASHDFGALNVTANFGVWLAADTPIGDLWFIDYGLGASVAVLRGLRVGAELFGDFRTSKPEHDHNLGPAVGYGQGRFWLSGTLGFGLSDGSPTRYGRIVLGLAF